MPQKYKRKEGAKARDPIPTDIMKQAVDRVLDGSALHTVAKEFGLSRNTLRRYVRKIQRNETTDFQPSYRPNQVFSAEEENELAKYLETMARMNHGLTTKMISKLAYDLAVKNNKKYPESWDQEKRAGYYWRQGFMERHPELSLKKPEATSLSRSTSFNKHNVSTFYQNLREVLNREKFGPESIWNADETGVTTVQRCPKIIAPKKLRQVGLVTSAERGQTVTVLNAINALGNSIPPFFIFPRQKMNPAFLFGAPPGSDGAAYISGWMTEENFALYLKHFVKYTRCSKEKKVLLLIDNHETHISLPAIDFARENGIIILTFPPHCSHRLQPLDVAVYSSFKGCYNTCVTNRLMIEKPGTPLTIYDIASLVGKAFPQSFTPRNIMSGFEASGIWPFNDNKFTDVDFLCSAITDRPNPEIETVPDAAEIAQPATLQVGLPHEQRSTTHTGPDVVSRPSTSASTSFCVSPETLLPYPKAGPRKDNKKGRKKGKTMIATDTPNKLEIEMKHREREEKKRKKEERARKALFKQQFKLNKPIKKSKKPESESDTSQDLLSELEAEMDKSEAEMDKSESDMEVDTTKHVSLDCGLPEVNNWVVVKFIGQRSIKYFVGLVLEISSEEATVKFAKRIVVSKEGSRFKWPEIEDISTVEPEQIVSRLQPPKFIYQNDRVTSFLFKNEFNFIIE